MLKACHFWTDTGLGSFTLHYLRDKEKREVDFLVARDGARWFLTEVKLSATARLTRSLGHFQRQTNASNAFQVVVDAPFVDADPFTESGPVVVPARTLLSQLV